jgi:GSCFA family
LIEICAKIVIKFAISPLILFFLTMTFRTTFPFSPAPIGISHQTPIFAFGSCFAENIARRLERLAFPIQVNLFGILFNPISIAHGLEMLKKKPILTENDLFFQNNLWQSDAFHGRFSKPNLEETLLGMQQNVDLGHDFLQKANRWLLTLGTSTVFVKKFNQQIVANCHKLPAGLFERKRLSIQAIVDAFAPILEEQAAQIADFQTIITVSPIRHLRDSFVENQRSKAVLILAIEALARLYNFVHYFPAYELLLDDLRDYRFYEADMIHPNAQAIDYIFDFFVKTFMNEKTQAILKAVEKYRLRVEHRPFNSESDDYQQFRFKTEVLRQDLEKQFEIRLN